MWEKHNAASVGRGERPDQIARMASQLRAVNPDAAIAVHASVSDGAPLEESNAARLERLVQIAGAGTTIATAAAAMTLKAAYPEAWIEPLGELADLRAH